MRTNLVLLSVLCLICTAALSPAQYVPELINYQGRLTDDAGVPLDGVSVNLTFVFYELETGGSPLLTVQQNGVWVADGIFQVLIGSGTIIPGEQSILSNIFRKYNVVWMGISVNGDPEMTPRQTIASVAYSMMTENVATGAVDSPQLADAAVTSAKIDDGTIVGADIHSDALGKAQIQDIYVLNAGDTMSGQLAVTETKDSAVVGYSPYGGGYFASASSGATAYATVGGGNQGILAFGGSLGGRFEDLNDGSYVEVASGTDGVAAYASGRAGYFADADTAPTTYVTLAGAGTGVDAQGTVDAGHFWNGSNSSYAVLGTSTDRGISARGGETGGYFICLGGDAEVYAAYDDVGIQAEASTKGAYFRDTDGSSAADVAYGGRGIEARGTTYGGYFYDLGGSGRAYAGYGDRGIEARGSDMAGYFQNSTWDPTTGYAELGLHNCGLAGYGNDMGGYFEDIDGGTICRVAYGGYSTHGPGTKAFAQNHPYEEDKIVVYACLEGDEVGVYTRGTGRLEDGEARVALSPSFRLVTNPDVGLTATLTPAGDCNGLYVYSVSTEELVVRELGGGKSDVPFHFEVHGLRVGFEEMSAVQAKPEDLKIPNMDEYRRARQVDQGIRANVPLDRFLKMESNLKGIPPEKVDLSRGHALRDAIGEKKKQGLGRSPDAK